MEVIDTIMILRKCGFPNIVNPHTKSLKEPAEKDLWYFKMAILLNGLNEDILTIEQYDTFKELFEENEGITPSLNKDIAIRNDIYFKELNSCLKLAIDLFCHIENSNNEIFNKN